MAWTETWTGTFELYDPAPWLAELQIALNERVDICNARQDRSATIAKPSFLTAAATDFALFSSLTIADQIRDTIDALIPQFTDTTDADEWEGAAHTTAPPMPYWSEATLMAELGEARLEHSELDEFNFAWLSQQKRILDELRWTSQILNDISAPSAIACNSCSPPLPLEFTVTLSGLAGSIWADYNGANTVTHSGSGCTWANADGFVTVQWYGGANWIVNASSPPSERDGQIRWTGPADTCAPPGDYGTHSSCASVLASDCSGLGSTGCIVSAAAASLGFVNGQYRQAAGASFAAAVTAWNAAAWANGDGGELAESTARESAGTWTAHRRRFEFGPETDADEWVLDAPTITKLFVGGSPTSSPKKTINFYTALTTPAGASFECNDYGGATDQFSIFQTELTPTATATVPTLSVGDFATFTGTDPGAGNEQGWAVRDPFQVYMMYKWDVADGLEKVA